MQGFSKMTPEEAGRSRSVQPLANVFQGEWKDIRQLTYDYLEMLDVSHLSLRLPFPESQPLRYQFWCMVGAQESYLNHLRHGTWQGFSSSLDQFDEVTPNAIRQQMVAADKMTESILNVLDLQVALRDGRPAYKVVMQMIKHEMHHHGQLINYMFCHHLPIPSSWNQEWALAYED